MDNGPQVTTIDMEDRQVDWIIIFIGEPRHLRGLIGRILKLSELD